jgi:clathrin heavy chain
LGIDSKFFKFNVTHLESERYISVRDVDQNGTPQLTVIELFNKFNLVKRPGAKVDGSIMHIRDNIVALKAPMEGGKGHILQIFNMDKKQKLANLEFNDNITFWRWVDLEVLVVVTTNSVYHVSLANPEKEVKIFDRSGPLKDGQVIGYVLGPDRKWCALFAISTPDGGQTINGHIQLYLIDGGKQQMLEGHACTFGKVFLHNDTHKSNIFCFVERKAGETKSLVHITEISPPPEGAQKFKKNNEIVYDPSTPNDFPISLVVAEKYGLLYIVTKFGFVYIY